MTEMRCRNCRFLFKSRLPLPAGQPVDLSRPQFVAQCRRFPPSMLMVNHPPTWPVMSTDEQADHWCGEFAPRGIKQS